MPVFYSFPPLFPFPPPAESEGVWFGCPKFVKASSLRSIFFPLARASNFKYRSWSSLLYVALYVPPPCRVLPPPPSDNFELPQVSLSSPPLL